MVYKHHLCVHVSDNVRMMHDTDKLFAVAFLATASATKAANSVRQTGTLAALVRHLADDLPPRAGQFQKLDDLLRADTTAALNVGGAGLHAFKWELKRTCLALVLQCVPVGLRLAFILVDFLALPEDAAAVALGIKRSALRTRLTRVRMTIEGYLGPRCGHLDPTNPCTCTGRVGVAERNGMIKLPIIPVPRRSHARRSRSVAAMYQDLPLTWPPTLRGVAQ